MQAAPIRSDSEEPQSTQISRLEARIEGEEASRKELEEWWETALEIATEVKSPELRTKFLGMVKSAHKTKSQCRELQREKKECEDELDQQHTEFAREKEVVGEEIKKLKKDLDEGQYQNGRLRQQLHTSGVAQSRDKVPKEPRKRQWSQASYSEANNPSGSPHKQARVSLSGCSREQISAVLGGPDRGWGSMQGHCGTYHILLDINWDLFGQSPSCKQDVGKAIFGFGQVDNKVISRGIVFPLFVCDPRKRSRKFTYLGNYTATRLDPVAWGKLSKEVEERVIEIIQSRGLSADSNNCQAEMAMDHGSIHQQFLRGIFKVPCARLEFQDFDKHLDADVQNSLGRK